jgi:hypothetical protein
MRLIPPPGSVYDYSKASWQSISCIEARVSCFTQVPGMCSSAQWAANLNQNWAAMQVRTSLVMSLRKGCLMAQGFLHLFVNVPEPCANRGICHHLNWSVDRRVVRAVLKLQNRRKFKIAKNFRFSTNQATAKWSQRLAFGRRDSDSLTSSSSVNFLKALKAEWLPLAASSISNQTETDSLASVQSLPTAAVCVPRVSIDLPSLEYLCFSANLCQA